MHEDNTKLNLLFIGVLWSLFFAALSPVVFEYQTWRWYVCAGLVGVAALCLIMRRKMIAQAKRETKSGIDTVRSPLRMRVISGAGIIVIGGVLLLASRERISDSQEIRFLRGFLLMCVVFFLSTFARAGRKSKHWA